MIGTFTSAHDPTLRQNRCFLYHVIGNGTGEWRVPVGGMGAVAAELTRVAIEAGAELRTGAAVTSLRPLPTGGAQATLADGTTIESELVLANCAPAVLQRLLGEPYADPVGSQTKINIVVRRLPRFKSGHRPADRFRRDPAPGPGLPRAAAGVRDRRRPARSPTRCRARSTATP